MPCYHPISAWKDPGGKITFREDRAESGRLDLPCGQCIGCRIRRKQEWATRCMNEAAMHKRNCFVTLTYDAEHYQPSLNYTDFQTFIRALRKRGDVLRYFAAGEYGETLSRPHWHALLFGVDYARGHQVTDTAYECPELTAIWGKGFTSIGQCTPQSAAYVANYTIKKVNGRLSAAHYCRVDLRSGELVTVSPEIAHMSLGIGKTWLNKYWREVYEARDGIVAPGGYKQKPPRYYDKQMMKIDKRQMIERETERILQAITRKEDNTQQRLITKETVAKEKLKLKRRKL